MTDVLEERARERLRVAMNTHQTQDESASSTAIVLGALCLEHVVDPICACCGSEGESLRCGFVVRQQLVDIREKRVCTSKVGVRQEITYDCGSIDALNV